jgi:hypothetical protein
VPSALGRFPSSQGRVCVGLNGTCFAGLVCAHCSFHRPRNSSMHRRLLVIHLSEWMSKGEVAIWFVIVVFSRAAIAMRSFGIWAEMPPWRPRPGLYIELSWQEDVVSTPCERQILIKFGQTHESARLVRYRSGCISIGRESSGCQKVPFSSSGRANRSLTPHRKSTG